MACIRADRSAATEDLAENTGIRVLGRIRTDDGRKRMTQLTSRNTECAVCRHESYQQFLLSASSIGSPDLDTRPAGLARNASMNAIQQCPACGYCAREIDVAPEVAASLVASKVYLSTVTFPSQSDLANRWHHRSIMLAAQWHGLSLIEEADGAIASAGWSALTSAWVYDDAKLVSLAKVSRLRALSLFQRALELNVHFYSDVQMEVVIIADLLRRTDDFGAAVRLCDQAESTDKSNTVRQILTFQRVLALRRDVRSHSISEAPGKNRVRRRRAS